MAVQPKAAGSSLMVQVTHKLLADLLKRGFGLGGFSKLIILPVATGMAVMLCIMNLRNRVLKGQPIQFISKKKKIHETKINPKVQRNKVIFLRIDQKSCIKAILSLGLEPIVIETRKIKLSEHQLQTNSKSNKEDQIFGLESDLSQLRKVLEEQASSVLCILSTSSCFAPREPDDIEAIGSLAREFGVYHVTNNAYGLQCSKTIDMLNRAGTQGLVHYIVQSTDKNFCVPVGGSVGKFS